MAATSLVAEPLHIDERRAALPTRPRVLRALTGTIGVYQVSRAIITAFTLAIGAWASTSGAQNACRSPLPPGAIRFNAEFSSITSVRELRSGEVLVADLGQRGLFVLDDPASRVARQISREGDGPGEYRAPRWIFALGQDSSLVTDAQTRRWLAVDGASVLQSVPADERLQRTLDPDLKGADQNGHVLQVLFDVRRQLRGVADTGFVILADRETGYIDTVAGLARPPKPISEVRFPGSPITYYIGNPLIVNEQAVLFPDGWVAIARADPYRVDWITSARSLRPGRPLPTVRVVVNDDEKRAAAARESYPDRGIVYEPKHFVAWPPTLPAFTRDALMAGPEGNLLVRRMPSAHDKSTLYDVIDRSGILIGNVRLPEYQHIIGFGLESVYIVCTDELDVPSLERHRWPDLLQRR